MPFDPTVGERMPAAWKAVVQNLLQREWGSEGIALQIARNAGPIQLKTAKTLIREAIASGYLIAEPASTTRHRTYLRIRLAYVDGCPQCVDTRNAPRHIALTKRRARCQYECDRCGHAWTTNWARATAGAA